MRANQIEWAGYLLGLDSKQTRLTFDVGGSTSPIWSPDGLQISFQGNRLGAATLRTRPVSGAGDETELVAGASVTPIDWSADAGFIAFNRFSSAGGSDVWVFPLGGGRKPFPFVQTPFGEGWASFSPDGKWIAYASLDRSARNSVYARPFPPLSGGLSQISPDGGVYPRWRGDGKELFFVSLDGTMMAVDVDTSGENIRRGVPTPLFKRTSLLLARGRPYDVSSDGKRFLVNLQVEGSAPAPIIVVVNWAATLQH